MLVFVFSAGGARPTPPKPAASKKPPSETELIRALPDEERWWLTEFVAQIILPEERKVFLELAEPYQREAFKLDFWARREKDDLPRPFGSGYRDRYEEMWKLAEEKYDGWRHDPGRILLRWGEPTDILKPSCGGEDVFYGLEVWTYSFVGSSGRDTLKFILYRKFRNGPFWLWSEGVRNWEVFVGLPCRRSFSALSKDCVLAPGDDCAMCEDRCRVFKAYVEIKKRHGGVLGAMGEEARLLEPFKVSTEGLDRQKDRWATTTNPNARVILVEGPSSGAASVTATPTPRPPSGPPRKLSAEEVRERISQLEAKYREWLDITTPLLTEEELSAFLQLSPKEKDDFIKRFWKSHS